MRIQIAFLVKQGALTTLTSEEVEDFNKVLDQKEGDGYVVHSLKQLTTPIQEGCGGFEVNEECFRLGYCPAVPLGYREQSLYTLGFINFISPEINTGEDTPIDGVGIPTSSYITHIYDMGVFSGYRITEEGKVVHDYYVGPLFLPLEEGGYEVNPLLPIYPWGYRPSESIFDDDEEGEENLLHPYHTNVVDYFGLNLNPNKVYFGLEIEMIIPYEKEGEIANALAQFEINRQGIPTRDATVDAELVTVPMEPEQMKEWLENNKEFFNLISVGQGVGAHMHISKVAFVSQLAQAYFTIQVNEDTLNPEYQDLFGEPDYEFAEAKKKDLSDWKSVHRYEAVNTLNESTIEVRAFRGTNDPDLLKDRVDYLIEKIEEANNKASSLE